MSDDVTTPPGTPDGLASDPPPAVPIARPVPADVIASFADPMLLLSESRKQVWADVGVLILLLIAFEVTVGMVFRVAVGDVDVDALDKVLTRDALIPLLGMRATMACAVVYLLARHRRQSSATIGLVRRDWLVNVGLGGLAAVCIYGVGVLTILLLAQLFPSTMSEMSENAARLKEMIPPLPTWAYFLLAMLIGVYEELLFRGFLMPRIRRGTGSWLVAVVVSTGLFTLLHVGDQNSPALLLVAILSLVFSVLTIWRRSLIPAIIAHTLWDLSQFLLLHSLVGQPQG